jgi:hypothetical protein
MTETPFTRRQGCIGWAKEITIWEEAPESLRYFVLEAATETNDRRLLAEPEPH